jgi:multimeric flavodoxin WrbA
MKIAIVSGSHRVKAESLRVSQYLSSALKKSGIDSDVISLSGNPLPLWSEEVFDNADFQKTWGQMSKTLQESDGLIVVSPEWAGMVPAGLKNFFLFCSNAELAHKPGLIVGVSAGIGGSYPIAELRDSSYKNNRLCYIPDHLIIRSVGEMLHGDAPANDRDASLRKRIDYTLNTFAKYAEALRTVRAANVLDLDNFPFGM